MCKSVKTQVLTQKYFKPTVACTTCIVKVAFVLEATDWHYPTSSVDASSQVPKLNTFIRILLRVNDANSTVNCSSVTGAIVLVIEVLEGGYSRTNGRCG